MKTGNRLSKLVALAVTLMVAMSTVLPTSVIFAATTATTGKTIQIVATSDLHGKFYSWDYATNKTLTTGGLTKVATVVKELKKQNPNTILIDNGDTIQGNSAQIFFDGKTVHPMIAAFNEMGYASMTLGNHEFNYGVDNLEKVAAGLKNTTILCGNVYKPDGKRLGEAYKIVECDGVKVAIIGMVTPHITKWDAANLKNYKVTSPIEETKKAIAEIQKNKSADVIIASVHMSAGGEYGDDSCKELAKACPELAAVIAGHEHAKLEGQLAEGSKAFITEPGTSGEFVSVVELKLTADKKVESAATRIVSTKDVKDDEALAKILLPYHEKALADAATPIGKLEGGALIPPAKMNGIAQGQLQDNALVDLITEVQMYYAEQSGAIPKGAHHVSSTALFSTEANVQPGAIKRCDTANIYKYDNTLRTLKVTGKELKKYMEWSAAYYNTFKTGDLNISFDQNIRIYNYDMFNGVKYEINISKEPGKRIEKLTYLDGKAVNDADEIYLTVNNYRCDSVLLANVFKDDKDVKVVYDNSSETVSNIRDLVGQYIEQVKKGVIKPNVDNNWKITGYVIDAAKEAKAIELVNSGALKLPTSEDGRTPNVKSLTWADVEAAMKNPATTKDTTKETTTETTTKKAA